MFLRFNILLFLGLANAFIFPLFIQPKHTVLNLSKYPKRQNSVYPLSKVYHDQYMRRLHSGNFTSFNKRNPIIKKIKRDREFKRNYYEREEADDDDQDEYEMDDEEMDMFQKLLNQDGENNTMPLGGFRIVIRPGMQPVDDDGVERDIWGRPIRSTLPPRSNPSNPDKKSENFEVITKSPFNFSNVGGYDNIKQELDQCVDLLSNYTKYAAYNVRIPKGLIFEGPPGNGKTMLAKALAGEAKVGFITVSGSQFQDKYVGVGSGRVRELFELAQKNIPCIIFIDEIDAIGRKRSGDGETAGSERDNTLNELLIALDGFKNTSGIFVIGATNRADLLDDALLRPGRIDKRIYIGNPDAKTRRAILNIHSTGKPYDNSVVIDELVETTNGLSGAQLENLLNEAMLNALRQDRTKFTDVDIDLVMNKMMVGWQPNEHQFTSDIIDHIAIHELGHAVVGLLSKHHSKMQKVVINLSAPKSPAYTIFESSASTILTREALSEHLMILLSGRIAEEVVYGVSVTTGAINDFEEALKLAQRMICYYGMGKQPIYPSMSEKYKEEIDTEVSTLINDAYAYGEFLIRNSKELLIEGAEVLKKQKVMKAEELIEIMNKKYNSIFNLKI
uniref:AAA+ ATPase domain-containing protein n=1 Tax=viral metagenome TaxID=1070528 RepID=A0A6C0L7Q1_9ZZZZ